MFTPMFHACKNCSFNKNLNYEERKTCRGRKNCEGDDRWVADNSRTLNIIDSRSAAATGDDKTTVLNTPNCIPNIAKHADCGARREN